MKNQRKSGSRKASPGGAHGSAYQGPQKALHIKDKLAEKTSHKKPLKDAKSSLLGFMNSVKP